MCDHTCIGDANCFTPGTWAFCLDCGRTFECTVGDDGEHYWKFLAFLSSNED